MNRDAALQKMAAIGRKDPVLFKTPYKAYFYDLNDIDSSSVSLVPLAVKQLDTLPPEGIIFEFSGQTYQVQEWYISGDTGDLVIILNEVSQRIKVTALSGNPD